jgi:hypothetical protein
MKYSEDNTKEAMRIIQKNKELISFWNRMPIFRNGNPRVMNGLAVRRTRKDKNEMKQDEMVTFVHY